GMPTATATAKVTIRTTVTATGMATATTTGTATATARTARVRVRTTVKATARTAAATTTDPRATSCLSRGARPSCAVDAHLDGGCPLSDRVRLIRDHPGRGPERHSHRRLRGARRGACRPGAILATARPASAARGRSGLVTGPAGGDSP